MKGSTVRRLVLGFALVPALVAAQSGQVQLSLTETGVTLIAENATPREILAEWKRVTGATVVGLEGLGGAPLTLRLENVAEREALDAVLRGTAGRLYVDREVPASGQSQFDRIVVRPTQPKPAAATRAAATAPQVPAHAYQPNENAEPVSVDEVFEEQNAAAEAEAMEAFADAAGGSAAEGQQAEAAASSPSPVPAPMSPVVGPDEEVNPPTSTDFDYANPQRYFETRARQMQERLQAQREAAAGGADTSQTGSVYIPGGQSSGGVTVVGGSEGSSGATPSTVPGSSTVPSATPPPNQGAQDAGTPGQIPANTTPYGLPSDVLPGSQAPPPGSPAYQGRYFNPYQPSGQQAGQSGSSPSNQKPPSQ
ncbi:MAG: hypothetical protein GEV06_02925 [Luteitalea sp.]|nr:hypothetical protein [Luteitalea sp.]